MCELHFNHKLVWYADWKGGRHYAENFNRWGRHRYSRTFEKFLQEVGYEISIANDGMEAISLFSTIHFDLILLDIMLPKLMDLLFAS